MMENTTKMMENTTVAHDDVWERLRQKLDGMTKGYPKTEKGYEYPFLQKVFTPELAEAFIKFPRGFQSIDDIAGFLEVTPERAKEIVDQMDERHLVYWKNFGLERKYRIVPFIHGVWEFNVAVIDKQDAKNMGGIYMGGWAKSYMDYETPMDRVIPYHADQVKDGKLLPIDDMERIIRSRNLIVVTDCPCRTVAKFSRKHCSCTDEVNVCLQFNETAEFYLEENIGHPRVISAEEALEIMRKAEKAGYVIQTSHTKDAAGMCNCPPCHCGLLMAAKIDLGSCFQNWSNYRCVHNEETCNSCGRCVARCTLNALHFEGEGEERKVVLDPHKCMGCGLCVGVCPTESVILERKPDDELTLPQDDEFYDLLDRHGLERARIDAARAAQAAEKEN